MADILYVYKNQVYVNLTNKCSGNCVFCIRNEKSGVGDNNLILEKEPTLAELKREIDLFSFDDYEELVFCGYGEPTCVLENLVETARYFRERHSQKVRVNTNGLGSLYNHRDILPELSKVCDAFSISLNAPNKKRYNELVRPPYENAYEEVIRFGIDAKKLGKEVVFSVVSILTEAEIEQCRILAEQFGIPLKVRANEQPEIGAYKVAVASGDGIVVNRHFGRADALYIYEVTKNGKYRLLETRTVTPVCHGGTHSDIELRENVSKLKDCKYVLVSKIGMGAAAVLEQSGIIPMELPGFIEESLSKLITYEQLQNLI